MKTADVQPQEFTSLMFTCMSVQMVPFLSFVSVNVCRVSVHCVSVCVWL